MLFPFYLVSIGFFKKRLFKPLSIGGEKNSYFHWSDPKCNNSNLQPGHSSTSLSAGPILRTDPGL